MTSLLRIDDIHSYYGNSHILQGISIDVRPGQVVAVIGRNGVGKTTLMRSIIGLTILLAGAKSYLTAQTSHACRSPHVIARLGIGYVPQGRRIFPSLTVLKEAQL